MALIHQNIKYLRRKLQKTQEEFACIIGIKRSLVGAYEEARAEPKLSTLTKIADQFDTSIDVLVNHDISTYTDDQIRNPSSKTKLKVLPITIDSEDNENIELVPQKASAGYLNGFSDPEFIEELPKFRIPILPQNATYRAFEIQGDSMLPLQPGTIIIGQYVERVEYIKNGKTYILITSDEGVVYKRVFNYLEEKGKFYLVSDNKSYAAYEVEPSKIHEIWEAKAYISTSFPDELMKNDEENSLSVNELKSIVLELQNEVIKIKSKVEGG